MVAARNSPFDHALQNANVWLADVAKAFATQDRRFAHRVLRTWLHTLRDRLTVDGAAQFAAQLPELLRGLFYDGWDPSRVPIKYGPDEYLIRFAQEARIPLDDVPRTAATIAGALRGHLSPGQLSNAVGQLPPRLRNLIVGTEPGLSPAMAPAEVSQPETPSIDDRVGKLEAQIASVTEALLTLARGLEPIPGAEPDEERAPKAARQAHEILLTMPN